MPVGAQNNWSLADEGLFLPIYYNYIVITFVWTEENRHFLPTRVASSYTSKWRKGKIKVSSIFIIFNVTVDAGVLLDFIL